jgi:hypothetical protein
LLLLWTTGPIKTLPPCFKATVTAFTYAVAAAVVTAVVAAVVDNIGDLVQLKCCQLIS